ncbi:MAG: PD40 domain-containing protein [Candidatus Brocadiae bacterium]|nr:PD40 domain-containing protein [Candidatus Brocadiia bacterium]
MTRPRHPATARRRFAAGTSVLLIAAAASVAAAAGQQPVPHIPLMTGWKVKPAPALKGPVEGFFRPDFDDSAWATADIKVGEPPYKARFVLYRRWVQVPVSWKRKPVSIAFGAVDDDAVVYVNGRKVGRHMGWDQAFALDVTKVVKCGARNLVAVLADNSGGGASGIWKPVSFVLAGELERIEAAGEAAARAKQATVRNEFKRVPCQIVYETHREGNWELFLVNADGSHPVNLTRTPDVDELYPHVSPDGTKVCFVVDKGKGKDKVRSVYYMHMDGTGRILVARHARQACWGLDGGTIAYLKGEFDRFRYTDFATRGIFFYNLKSGEHRQHPNKEIKHLYNLCTVPGGKWFVATVHGGMGFKHAILAIEADGPKVFNLGIGGCRPDVSPDGKQIAWGVSDWALRVGELDFSSPQPRVIHQRNIVTSKKPMKIYHLDWSPDGRHIAFSRGPTGKTLGHACEIVGIPAKGWNICVADATQTNHWAPITSDGLCNKEPDWVPARQEPRP